MSSNSDAFSASFSGQSQTYRPSFQTSPMQTPFKLDEGYSEETRSQSGSDAAMEPDSIAGAMPVQASTPSVGLPDWIMALGEHQRSGAHPSARPHIQFKKPN